MNKKQRIEQLEKQVELRQCVVTNLWEFLESSPEQRAKTLKMDKKVRAVVDSIVGSESYLAKMARKPLAEPGEEITFRVLNPPNGGPIAPFKSEPLS